MSHYSDRIRDVLGRKHPYDAQLDPLALEGYMRVGLGKGDGLATLGPREFEYEVAVAVECLRLYPETAALAISTLPGDMTIRDLITSGLSFKEIQRRILDEALCITGGGRKEAAALLKVSRSGLSYIAKRYGLRPAPDNRVRPATPGRPKRKPLTLVSRARGSAG